MRTRKAEEFLRLSMRFSTQLPAALHPLCRIFFVAHFSWCAAIALLSLMFCLRQPKPQYLRLYGAARCIHHSPQLQAARKPVTVRKPRKTKKAKDEVTAESGDGGELKDRLEAHFKAVSRQHGDKTRVSVTSEGLCDDIIQRLAPSLTRHTNCDIIDINPGAGLFSSKLHEHLAPRKHILMEPDTKLFRPFLQPLLDKPDSKFRIIEESGLLWDNLVALLQPEHLPHQKAYARDDPNLEKPNDTLLVIANLGHTNPRVFMGHKSVSILMTNQLISAIRTHSIFQRYGLVRMFIWLDDLEKTHFLPRTLVDRKRAAIEAEVACEYIHEVVGAAEDASRSQRLHELSVTSSKNVLEKMKQNNIVTPAHRMGPMEEEIRHGQIGTGVEERGRTWDTARTYLKELAELEEKFKNKEFVSCYLPDGTPYYGTSQFERFPRGTQVTSNMLRLRELRNRAKSSEKRGSMVEDFMMRYTLLTERGEELVKATSPSAEAEWEDLKLDQAVFLKEIERLPHSDKRAFWMRLEDYRALRFTPPTLYWDQREYEPLVADSKEFYPKKTLALLDIQPQAPWPVLRESNTDSSVVLEFLMSGLFMFPSAPIAHTLKSMAPGALEYLIAECPSLTDPSLGGSRDLWADFSVRGMTLPMLREILEAWMRWTFRPTTSDMVARMGLQGLKDSGEIELDMHGDSLDV